MTCPDHTGKLFIHCARRLHSEDEELHNSCALRAAFVLRAEQ